MKLQLTKPLVFVDIEATGPNSAVDRIIEIALVRLKPDGTDESRTFRINPGQPIPAEVSRLTGITDVDVKECPAFDDVAAEIAAFIGDADLAGFYSNTFDIPILVEEFMRSEFAFDTDNRCLIDVFRIYTKKEKRDLVAAYKFYCDKEMENHHSAVSDATATMEILLSQLQKYEDLATTAGGLNEYSRDKEFVDFGKRMIYQNGEPHFNFGKFKGKKVREVLEREPQYYDWIMKGDFHLHTKKKLTEIRQSMRNRDLRFRNRPI
jgi:DNA polymerase-3 subunit epsilon